MKFIREGKITFAAELLFGAPDCAIRIGRFKSEATIIDDIVVRSLLLLAVEEALTLFVRIRDFLSTYPEIALNIDEMGDFFKVELRHIAQAPPPIIPVTDLEQQILQLLIDLPTSSSSNLARRCPCAEIRSRLKAKGLLVREGSTRTGRWSVTDAGKASLSAQ